MVISRLEEEFFPVSHVCEALDVSRSAYYAWRRDELSARRREDDRLRPHVRRVFHEHRRRYGARRIAAELSATGFSCSRRRAGRLMKEMGLLAIQPRSFKPRTTDSRHGLGYSPNLLLEAAPPSTLDQLWLGDITYLPLAGGGFLYLAVLMDQYSRRIVGWDLQRHMQESLVIAALQAAIAARQPRPGLIHHTDRGGQYAGREYRRMLARARIVQSMSRADNCYDNAFMESCFGTLKTELQIKVYEHAYAARREISAYIRYYNTRRRHSSLDYLAPEAFEAQCV